MTTSKASLFRMLMVLAAAALAASLLILIAAGEPVQAALGDKGKIAFASDRAGNLDIWVMNSDGTNPLQLTSDPLTEAFPAFSPDGRKIAFTRGQRGPGQEIWVMDSDGTNPIRLTSNVVQDVYPTWSQDGRKIAFVRTISSTDREIYVMDATDRDGDGNGDNQTNLTNDPATIDYQPDWSPDGKRIAFTSETSDSAAIYTMRPDGTQLRKLTGDDLEAQFPTWSPTGDKLAFSDHSIHGESDLFVMKSNGTGVMQLFETPENDTGATWAPDGGRMAFERFDVMPGGGKTLVLGTGEIYVVGEDGGGLKNLTNNPGSDDEHPDWSPE